MLRHNPTCHNLGYGYGRKWKHQGYGYGDKLTVIGYGYGDFHL